MPAPSSPPHRRSDDPRPNLHIAGVPVAFPHTPYRAQNALMHAVVTAVHNRTHALVESPTGTGKSLALLCSTLAVQGHIRRTRPTRPAPKSDTDGADQPRATSSSDAAASESAIKPDADGAQDGRDTDGRRDPAQANNNAQPQPAQSPRASSPPAARRAPAHTRGDDVRDPPQEQVPTAPTAKKEELDSDSDDFQAPRSHPDVSWQRPVSAAPKKRRAVERPENEFMLHRADMPLDPPSGRDALAQSDDDSEADGSDTEEQRRPRDKIPRIFYATRTHNQLAHVVAELRKTPYRPRMAVLASRREYCLRPDVRDQAQRDDVCKRLVSESCCGLFRGAADLASNPELAGAAWDVEELCRVGERTGGCAYYASHELYQDAQLVLCPYSYLIDPVVRGARGIDLSGDVVVLDEAHNVEHTARDAASFATDIADLRAVVDDVDSLVLRAGAIDVRADLVAAYQRLRALLDALLSLADDVLASGDLEQGFHAEAAVYERDRLVNVLERAEITRDEVPYWRAAHEYIANYGDGNEAKRAKKMDLHLASQAPEAENGVGAKKRDACDTPGATDAKAGKRGPGVDAKPGTSADAAESKESAVKKVGPGPSKSATESRQKTSASGEAAASSSASTPASTGAGYGYGCDPAASRASSSGLNIEESATSTTPGGDRFRGRPGSRGRGRGRGRGRARRLRRRGRAGAGGHEEEADGGDVPWIGKCVSTAHSLLTTLELLFEQPDDFLLVVERRTADFVTVVRVSIHCLNAAVCFRQVSRIARTVVVASGTLTPMSSFAGELGTHFAIAKSVPHVIDVRRQLYVGVVASGSQGEQFNATFHGAARFDFQDGVGNALVDYARVVPGGMLVFAPSYRMLATLQGRWQQTEVWAALHAAKGTVLVEPAQRGPEFDTVVSQYTAACASDERNDGSPGGALLFGVCRGKLSEGVDFRDEMARAVVIIGIPFPHKGDVLVARKRAWNDRMRQSLNSSGGGGASGGAKKEEHKAGLKPAPAPAQTQKEERRKQRNDRQQQMHLQCGSDWYEMQAYRALNQAVGRVVRHRFDYGAIVLLDARFRGERVLRQVSGWVRAAICGTDGRHGHVLRELEHFYETVQSRVAGRAETDAGAGAAGAGLPGR